MDLTGNRHYQALQERLRRGWHTWNVYSILSHVRMKDGLALNIALKEYRTGRYLKETLIGRQAEHRDFYGAVEETVYPGLHAYDDSYTEATVEWQDIRFKVESMNDGEDIAILVTPEKTQRWPSMLVLETGFLWNRPGSIEGEGGLLTAKSPFAETRIRTTAKKIDRSDANIPAQGRYIACALTEPIAFYTGEPRTVSDIREKLDANRSKLLERFSAYGDFSSVYEAVQCAVAWDTTYDGAKDRIASPISRHWSIGAGGFILACWDNYFCSFMASLEDRDLAYANIIEITREQTRSGFVPNIAHACGYTSEDRSQPPVGSAMLVEIYRRYRERWIVELLYPAFREWNRWFYENRRNAQTGAFCWGSTPYEGKRGTHWETAGVNDTYGAALESGMDNSPQYDGVPFDSEKHVMKLEDVGLTGLYILDCKSMIRLARLLGLDEDVTLYADRLRETQKGLEGLWDESFGFYCNRRTDTGEFSHRLSAANFYALFDDTIPVERARRMADEHYYNPEEFYGKWMIPMIARNDPAYPDQDYWRGRVWPSSNFLAYSAIRSFGQIRDVQKDLAEHSVALMMKEWTERRHIHENYNADTGEGCDVRNSDPFYHWGALLGVIGLIEQDMLGDYLEDI